MKTLYLRIEGMNCSACQKIIELELADLKGVIETEIDVKESSGKIKIDSGTETALVLAAIEKAGYKAKLLREE